MTSSASMVDVTKWQSLLGTVWPSEARREVWCTTLGCGLRYRCPRFSETRATHDVKLSTLLAHFSPSLTAARSLRRDGQHSFLRHNLDGYNGSGNSLTHSARITSQVRSQKDLMTPQLPFKRVSIHSPRMVGPRLLSLLKTGLNIGVGDRY